MSGFVEILRALQSGDNAVRSAAEAQYQESKKQQSAQTVAGLFQVLNEQNLEEAVREQAAVLLRQCLGGLRDDNSIWSKLGDAAQTECRTKLLQLLEAESQRKVRRKIADIIQSLGNQLIDIEPEQRPQNSEIWPELVPFLMKVIMDTSKDNGLRADALWAVEEMMVSIWQILVTNATQTLQVLKASLGDASESVRAQAGALFSALLDNLEAKEDRATFAPLAADICTVLQQLADSSDNTYINTMLTAMQGTSESVNFYKDFLQTNLMPLLCKIAKAHPEEETQKLALEVLVSFLEKKPKTVSKIPGYLQQTLEICVKFIMQIRDDVDEWSKGEDGEDDDEEDEKSYGEEVVDRLCKSMTHNFSMMMDVLRPVLQTLVQASEWKQVVAGLSIMCQIAEYVEDDAVLVQMLIVIKGHLSSSHPRVRHAAWAAVAQFSQDHSEHVASETFVQQLLSDFLSGLDEANQRVLERSMEAFQLFGSEVEREVLEPFVQPMMAKLVGKLQCGSLKIQKTAITYIAVIAMQVEDAFAPYYSQLMPSFKQLIQNTLHNEKERELLGKTFECVSWLAKAVGTAGFRADAESIMQSMIQATQIPNLKSNDPVKEYMMQASERICATMKADFLPFVPHLLPGILEKFTLAPKEFSEANQEGLDEDTEINLALLKENGQVKVLIMSTSEVEDLSNAVACVHTFVEELGKAYAPFVGQTAQALLPVFEFSMAEEVRDLAFETWGQLCHVAREGGETTTLSELVLEFLRRILPKLEGTAEATMDLAALKTRADGVSACLKKAGPSVLSPEQVRHICKVAFGGITNSLKMREERKKQAKANTTGDDEDAEEGDAEREKTEQSFRLACCEMAGALMNHHANEFVAQNLEECLMFVQQFIQATNVLDDRRLAMFIACDMLEHLGAQVTSRWQQFLPALLVDIKHADPSVRQLACYGASLAAKNPAFTPFAAETAQQLVDVITQSRSRGKKKSEQEVQSAADNAVSALVEILTKHQDALAGAQAKLWGIWLQALPCQVDEQEGVKNHKLLLQAVVSNQPAIMGEGNANFSQILSVLIDVYKTEMADDETSKGIGQIVVKLGEAGLQQYAAQLKEKQQKKLLRIHREAQQ